MALKKAAKVAPTVFYKEGTWGTNPNALKLMPNQIGDLFVDVYDKQLYFAFGLSGTQWGTCGSAGT